MSTPPLNTIAPLTRRQREILDTARTYHARYGSWPSRKVLGMALGIPDSGYLQRVLAKLRETGHIPRVKSSGETWWEEVQFRIKARAAAAGVEVSPALIDIVREAVEIEYA